MPSSAIPDRRLASMIDAALAGARVVMRVYKTDFSVSHKVDDSPVSEADLGSERAIAAALAETMAGIPIVAEEEAAAGELPKVGKTFLLVDPLDGTKEFISRNGEFTVNIALIEDGVPRAGVVIAPALSLAYAGSAVGAFKGTISAELEQHRRLVADSCAPDDRAPGRGREPLAHEPGNRDGAVASGVRRASLDRLVAEILSPRRGHGGFLSAAWADDGVGHGSRRRGASRGRRRAS